MSSDDWRFPNTATPAGSSAYFSVLFTPAELRDPIALLHAWRGEIRNVLKDCSDPGVTRMKLQWWREELQRAVNGEARHPLAQRLMPVMETFNLPSQPFLDMTEAAEDEVRQLATNTLSDLETRCRNDLGALFELIGHCHGNSDPESLRKTGTNAGLIYLVRDLETNASRLLPESLGSEREALKNLVEHIRKCHVEGNQMAKMPPGIAVRTALSMKLLNQLERSDIRGKDRPPRLPPLTKLWIAWRAARKARS